jgi:alkylation response protein AidB-like acyl-CoA dehydrogenase
MASLAFERGTAFVAEQIDMQNKVEALITYAREHPAPGGRKKAIDDDEFRRRLATLRAEVAAMRAMSLATVSRIQREGKPGPEGSLTRLYYGQLTQSIWRLGLDLLGPERLTLSPATQGITHPYLRTFCNTISGGSAQIQRDSYATRVLGLPRAR